eukprot:TRINITY_DN2326_c0_g1_i1.p1 TRINITY_DN2326_c0_g1~~TRINITY_DN2326_c0_g1_i1.p1  ORF type:complete len:488 (+),score=108.11 TRINITY_DN2326_c0_g1_i1:88-1464(+)
MSLSFNCSICSQTLHQPCCLVECGHTFCFGCLVNKVTQNPGETAVAICPLCSVSSGCSSAEDMKKEFREPVTETFIEVFGTEKLVGLNGPSSCNGEGCKGRAEVWCPSCKYNLCKTCHEDHCKNQSLHEVTPLSQKKNDDIFAECSNCHIKTTSFCETCNQVLCRNCGEQGHKDHEVTNLADQVKIRREDLKTFIDEVKGHFQQSEKKKKELHQELERIQKEIKEEAIKNRILKSSVEKLSLVSEQLNDDGLALEPESKFIKFEKQLREKLQVPDLKIRQLKHFKDSTVIIGGEDQHLLVEWLKDVRGEENVRKVQLLFRGTRDGFGAQEFHSRCDSKGPTIVVFKTSEERRGGGYSAQSWTSNEADEFIKDETNTSFVFSLDYREKYSSSGGTAINCYSASGPCFGGMGYGYDLFIATNCNETDENESGRSCYETPPNGLAGSWSFTVTEYEVWKVM